MNTPSPTLKYPLCDHAKSSTSLVNQRWKFKVKYRKMMDECCLNTCLGTIR